MLEQMTTLNDAEKERKEAIRKALTNLKENGGTTISKVGLSTAQSGIVDKIEKFHKSGLNKTIKDKFVEIVKSDKVNSLYQVNDLLSERRFELKK